MGPYIALGIVGLVVFGGITVVALVLYFAHTNRPQVAPAAPVQPAPAHIDVIADVYLVDVCLPCDHTACAQDDDIADVYLVDVCLPCDHTACAQDDDIARLQAQIEELRRDHEVLRGRLFRLASNVSLLAQQLGRLARTRFFTHIHGQYALRTEVDRLSFEVDRLRNPQRWTPSRLAAIIGAVVGALVGWGTLFLVTAHPFTFVQGVTQRHFDLNVGNIVFQLVWVALFTIVGAGVAVFMHGLFSRNQEV